MANGLGVANQYQRRAALISNVVNTERGYAAQVREVLLSVTDSRAKASSFQATPALVKGPAAFAKFQPAQGEVSGVPK